MLNSNIIVSTLVRIAKPMSGLLICDRYLPFLQLVRLITQTVKTKKYKADSKLFDKFLYLNLHDVTVGKQSEVNNNMKLKKDVTTIYMSKKRMKSVVKLQRELKEAKAIESKEKRTKY